MGESVKLCSTVQRWRKILECHLLLSPQLLQSVRQSQSVVPAEVVPLAMALPRPRPRGKVAIGLATECAFCCPASRCNNSRFCKDHKRSYDAMAYQAKAAEAAGQEGAVEAFSNAMASDYTAGVEVSKFAELNPPHQLYAKKQFIDWANFVESHGKRVSETDRSKAKPMWKCEFMKWCMDVKALTEQEASDWWSELEADPAVQRDNLGFRGRLQLWVPNIKSKLNDTTTFSEYTQQQGNKAIQKPNADHVDMLRQHVMRQNVSRNNEFLRKAVAKAASSVDDSDVGQQDSDPKPVLKKDKLVDLDREGPKLLKSMNKDHCFDKGFCHCQEQAGGRVQAGAGLQPQALLG